LFSRVPKGEAPGARMFLVRTLWLKAGSSLTTPELKIRSGARALRMTRL